MDTRERIKKMFKKTEPIMQAGRKLPKKNKMRAEILSMALAVNTICRVYSNCSECPVFIDGLCVAGPDELPIMVREKVCMIIESGMKE